MDIHDTSLKSILEDDSISLTSKAGIHSPCSNKNESILQGEWQKCHSGYGWLLSHLFIRFALHTYFHLNIVFSSWFDSAFNI
jgi:hypothetical protein